MNKDEALRRVEAAERELEAAREALKASEELRLWVPREDERYWRVDGFGVEVDPFVYVTLSERVDFGNAIRTEAEAKRHALRLRAFNVACRLATEAGNPGGLRVRGETQWYISRAGWTWVSAPRSTSTSCCPHTVYFPSSDSCEQAIRIIGQEALEALWGPL